MTIKSVRRAVRLLKSFSRERPELGVSELARMHRLHPSTVSRLLATFADEDLVRINPETHRYRLGFGILETAGIFLAQFDIRLIAQPVMRELGDAVRETVNLSVLVGNEAVIIDQVPVREGVALVSWIGRRVPLYATSHGKALLAFQEPARQAVLLDAIMNGRTTLPAFTRKTIRTRRELVAELSAVLRNGYATSYGELNPESAGLGVPILDAAGTAVAALTTAGPMYRMTQEKVSAVIPLIIAAGRKISSELGWQSQVDLTAARGRRSLPVAARVAPR